MECEVKLMIVSAYRRLVVGTAALFEVSWAPRQSEGITVRKDLYTVQSAGFWGSGLQLVITGNFYLKKNFFLSNFICFREYKP